MPLRRVVCWFGMWNDSQRFGRLNRFNCGSWRQDASSSFVKGRHAAGLRKPECGSHAPAVSLWAVRSAEGHVRQIQPEGTAIARWRVWVLGSNATENLRV